LQQSLGEDFVRHMVQHAQAVDKAGGKKANLKDKTKADLPYSLTSYVKKPKDDSSIPKEKRGSCKTMIKCQGDDFACCTSCEAFREGKEAQVFAPFLPLQKTGACEAFPTVLSRSGT
jgi:hypothetical protein